MPQDGLSSRHSRGQALAGGGSVNAHVTLLQLSTLYLVPADRLSNDAGCDLRVCMYVCMYAHSARHTLLHIAPKWSSHRTTRAGCDLHVFAGSMRREREGEHAVL